MTKNNKVIWQYPWGYIESFLIAISLVVLGFSLDFVSETKMSVIHWPTNLYIGVAVIILLLLLHSFFKEKKIIKWLSNVKTSISAISIYAFLVLLMGLIPQGSPKASGFIHEIALTNIVHSYAFLFAQTYLLVVLGMVILRKGITLKPKDIAFFLNHFGLWLTLFAASLGAGDLQRVSLTVNKSDAVYSGINQKGKVIPDLGIAIKLIDFKIDEYSPKAFIVDNKSGDILNKSLFYLEKGNKAEIMNWQFDVTEYFNYAVNTGGKFYSVLDYGAPPAAYVVARNMKNNIVKKGWLSCGSFRYKGDFLELSDETILVMAEPEPKKYSSHIKVYTESGKIISDTVFVNKPISANGWKIYQIDYDQEKGRWSEISVLELVKDPWIKVVYFGIFLMMLGAIYMFWVGNKKKIL